MEPVQIGRDDAIDMAVPSSSWNWPQWSPSRSDGMTSARQVDPDVPQPAAMEPVQIGRDDLASSAPAGPAGGPQWSPSRSDGMTRLAREARHR